MRERTDHALLLATARGDEAAFAEPRRPPPPAARPLRDVALRTRRRPGRGRRPGRPRARAPRDRRRQGAGRRRGVAVRDRAQPLPRLLPRREADGRRCRPSCRAARRRPSRSSSRASASPARWTRSSGCRSAQRTALVGPRARGPQLRGARAPPGDDGAGGQVAAAPRARRRWPTRPRCPPSSRPLVARLARVRPGQIVMGMVAEHATGAAAIATIALAGTSALGSLHAPGPPAAPTAAQSQAALVRRRAPAAPGDPRPAPRGALRTRGCSTQDAGVLALRRPRAAGLQPARRRRYGPALGARAGRGGSTGPVVALRVGAARVASAERRVLSRDSPSRRGGTRPTFVVAARRARAQRSADDRPTAARPRSWR